MSFSTFTPSSARSDKLVRDAAQCQVLTCTPDISLKTATAMMQAENCSSIVIVADQIPVGIWTEADALRVDFTDTASLNRPVSAFMSTSLYTIDMQTTLDDAALEFRRQNIRHLIVTTENGELQGMLSQTDVVMHQNAEFFLSMTEIDSLLPVRHTVTLDQQQMFSEAVALMREHGQDALVVTARGEPVGMLTQRDLVRLIGEGYRDLPLADVMSTPLISVPRSMSLLATRSLMQKRCIRHIGVNDDAGKFAGLISFGDILNNIEQTYVRRLRAALANQSADLQDAAQQLHMAHTLIEASMDGIMVTNDDGIIESINPAFSILTGYSESEALGQKASLISSGKHDAEFYQQMWHYINTQGQWKGEIWNRRKNGEVYLEWLTITRILEPNSGRSLYAGIFSDITERKKSEQIIENLAYYDALTKLPNRQLLFDRLDVALAGAHRDSCNLALLFIDLDHFKRINDTLGHTIGDKVLIETADRLKNIIREGDTLARIGGDELILMLTEVSDADTVGRAVQRISECLQQPVIVEDNELYVSASIGCAIYPEDGEDRETLLKNADIAMYRAKQTGRNTFHFYSSKMDELSHLHLKMESRLRGALANNELFLEYQPKRALDSERIVGVEALLRWQDKELGRVPPDQFIPLAEDLGLINEIGSWVLDQAAQQCQRWQAQGIEDLHVSVNVSALQFKQQAVIGQVEKALKHSHLQPSLLDIEITESCLLEDLKSVSRSLRHLRNLGLSISLDDFGTGFSSLSMLTQLQVDFLKIDRSFMQGIPGDPDSEMLVSTIILMAKNLGFKVVAEGVETAEQMAFLKDKDCDQIQGYYFSKPVSPERILEMMLPVPAVQE
ncbi:EAL domain-containing protein [Aliamphritea spongicola]|uniref:EAL domain-containing protein n=1 Tax=Aliamphritea spongicola TaxID=707589 RepID=UPI00196B0ACA|nr:EAL domain-containing protein [Aliamphritea spongicola]